MRDKHATSNVHAVCDGIKRYDVRNEALPVEQQYHLDGISALQLPTLTTQVTNRVLHLPSMNTSALQTFNIDLNKSPKGQFSKYMSHRDSTMYVSLL